MLTGDIIGSRKLSAGRLDEVRAALDGAARGIAEWRSGLLLGAPEYFRGDGWQLALAEPALGLRAALAIRAVLRALPGQPDTRVAIGVGLKTALAESLARSTGEAFVRSGHALEAMKRGRYLGVALDFHPPLLPPYVGMIDALVRRWTRRQAEVVQLRLMPDPPTQSAVGEALGERQQTIARIERGARLAVLIEAIETFERLFPGQEA